MTPEQLTAAIKQLDQLPSFPRALMELQRELGKKEPSVPKIAALVSTDPGLGARFLRLANSAFFNRGVPITKVEVAVARLGLRETRQVAVTAGTVMRYRNFGGKDPEQFWQHAIGVALSTGVILKTGTSPLSAEQQDAAYLGGLLHDIGIIALYQVAQSSYERVIEQATKDHGGVTPRDEQAQLGLHHGAAGQILASAWELPAAITSAIAYHHHPWDAPPDDRGLVLLIHLADFVCARAGLMRAESTMVTELEDEALSLFGLTLDHVPQIMEKTAQSVEQATAMLKQIQT